MYLRHYPGHEVGTGGPMIQSHVCRVEGLTVGDVRKQFPKGTGCFV